MSDDEVDQALVIDNGTWMCRAGWAGDDTARAYVRTVVGEKDGSKVCYFVSFLLIFSTHHCSTIHDANFI